MGGTSTTVQKADPWAPAQPYILEGLDAAQQMWNADPNQFVIKPWDGDAVAPMSDPSVSALDGLGSAANLNAQRSNLLGNQGALNMSRAMGQGNINPAQFETAVNNATNPAPNERFDRVVDRMTGDGYTDDMRAALRQNVMESVMPGVNETFAGSGQTGSSLHQAHLTKALASGMAPVEAGFIDRAQDRSMNAANMSHNAQQDRLGMGLQAGALAGDAYQKNQARALDAIRMAPAISDATYNPYRVQQGAGEVLDNRSQTERAAEIMAYQQEQAGPIDAINNYLSLTSGLGGQFGTSTATATQNPGILGILGGLSPLLGLFSDRRLKENIRRVGAMDDGTPVYVYSYKGDPVMRMGVMAQDVEKTRPEAVMTHSSGFKMVNYGALQ